ncbi:MAG: integrase core domain-containing protein [Candidatus Omnitrophica bacterium]|nr:integrase core domain-containing protein [Candidatus Omnitrophota bacterium]
MKEKGSGTIYIEPGSPCGNFYIESFNDKFWDECLNREIFLNERRRKNWWRKCGQGILNCRLR